MDADLVQNDILSLRFATTIVSDEHSETVVVVSVEESQKRLVAGNVVDTDVTASVVNES